MKNLMKDLRESQGANIDNLDGIFDEAALSFHNRYALLNFFLKFYFSRSYNDKVYRVKIL